MKYAFGCLIALCLSAMPVGAAERSTYKYDALGRLAIVRRNVTGGGPNNGNLVEYRHDAASNRSRVRSSGSFKGSALHADGALRVGEGLLSADGRFLFTLQFDGNLVLCDEVRVAIWNAGTGTGGDHSGDYLIMQTDGNLVLYRSDNAPRWATMTLGHGRLWLAVQPDGNVVLYRTDGNPVWSTGTCCR